MAHLASDMSNGHYTQNADQLEKLVLVLFLLIIFIIILLLMTYDFYCNNHCTCRLLRLELQDNLKYAGIIPMDKQERNKYFYERQRQLLIEDFTGQTSNAETTIWTGAIGERVKYLMPYSMSDTRSATAIESNTTISSKSADLLMK